MTNTRATNSHVSRASFHYIAIPSITQPPARRDLLRRLGPATEAEDASLKLSDTCGYVSGDPASIVLCTHGTCGWDVESNVVACGTNAFTCCAEHAFQAINTCMDVDPSRSLSCGHITAPYCGTMTYTEIHATGLVCVNDSAIRHQDIALQSTTATKDAPTANPRSNSSTGVNIPAAAGGATGGAVFLIAVLGIGSFFSIRIIRRKRSEKSKPGEKIDQGMGADGGPINADETLRSPISTKLNDIGGQPLEIEGKPHTQELDAGLGGYPNLIKSYFSNTQYLSGLTEVEGRPHAQELGASLAGPHESRWGRVEMP